MMDFREKFAAGLAIFFAPFLGAALATATGGCGAKQGDDWGVNTDHLRVSEEGGRGLDNLVLPKKPRKAVDLESTGELLFRSRN